MRTRRSHYLALRIRRCLVVGLALAGYLTATVGFPLPAVVKDVSRPFPCQNHSCGCLNADQCWRSCCCYSAAEKLAWAQTHQVEPPAEVEKGWRAPRLRDQHKPPATEGCCCCSKGSSRAPAPAQSARAEQAKQPTWVVDLLLGKT